MTRHRICHSLVPHFRDQGIVIGDVNPAIRLPAPIAPQKSTENGRKHCKHGHFGSDRLIYLVPPATLVSDDDSCWDSDGGRTGWNVIQNDCVGTYFCVLADRQLPDDLGACTYVDVTFDGWHAAGFLANRHLLKDQAIRPDLNIRMNDDAVWMRQEQTTPQFAIQRNIGARDCRPPPMFEYGQSAQPSGAKSSVIQQTLIIPNTRQKGARGGPFQHPFLLTGPVGDIRGYCRDLKGFGRIRHQNLRIIDTFRIHPDEDRHSQNVQLRNPSEKLSAGDILYTRQHMATMLLVPAFDLKISAIFTEVRSKAIEGG